MKPGVVDRFRDRLRRAQLVGGAARPRLGRIGFRRHARDGLEDAMEVVRAQARARRELGELGRLLGGFDPFARPLDRLNLRIGRAELVGPAALAGAVARLLGFSAGLEERDVLALGRPRGAARTAIDSGRAHGEQELAVERRIAALDRLPALFVASRRPDVSGWRVSVMGLDIRTAPGFVLFPRLGRSVSARTPLLAVQF